MKTEIRSWQGAVWSSAPHHVQTGTDLARAGSLGEAGQQVKRTAFAPWGSYCRQEKAVLRKNRTPPHPSPGRPWPRSRRPAKRLYVDFCTGSGHCTHEARSRARTVKGRTREAGCWGGRYTHREGSSLPTVPVEGSRALPPFTSVSLRLGKQSHTTHRWNIKGLRGL